MLYRPCIMVFIFLFPFCLVCQDSEWESKKLQIDSFRNHVILLLDRSGSMAKGRDMDALEEVFTKTLPDILFEKGKVIENKSLLQSNDHLSIASFGLGSFNDYNYEQFIHQRIGKEESSLGQTYTVLNKSDKLEQLWKKISAQPKAFFSANFTGLSFAGPIGFNYFSSDNKRVHRTFVLIISDGQFHSIDDPSSELSMKGVNDGQKRWQEFKNHQIIRDAFSEVKMHYSWHQGERYWQEGKYKIQLFEYIPNQLNLDIRSKVDFDPEIIIERKPGGYEKVLSFTDSDTTDLYVPQKAMVQLLNKKTGDTIFQDIRIFKGGTALFKLKHLSNSLVGDPLELYASFWVDYNDTAYGSHQLHPFGKKNAGSRGFSGNHKYKTGRKRKNIRAHTIMGWLIRFLCRFSWAQAAG